MKYYGTVLNGYRIPDEIKEKYKLGERHHVQFRLVVKAKSMTAANRKVKEIIGLDKVFLSDYTSQTGNVTEIEMCDKYGEIISNLHSNEFYDLKFIAEEVKKSR